MQLRRVLAAVLLTGALGACEFIDPITVDPNAVPEAALDQLFTGIQVNTWFFGEGQISRLAALWSQQMTGTDRQFTALDAYIFNEQDTDGEFQSIYTGGGLVDLKAAKALAEEQGRGAYGAILKVHEAYLFGMAASFWGDIPYSEAADPGIETPALDDQAQVYAAMQNLLSEAIGDLAGGSGPGVADFSFGEMRRQGPFPHALGGVGPLALRPGHRRSRAGHSGRRGQLGGHPRRSGLREQRLVSVRPRPVGIHLVR